MTSTPSPVDLGVIVEEVSGLLESGEYGAAVEKISSLRAADIASVVVETSGDEMVALVAAMEDAQVAEVLGELDVETASDVYQSISDERRPKVLDEAEPEVAADLLHRFDWEEASQILARMSTMDVVGELLIHQDDDAGGLMSPEFATIRDYWTVRHSLRILRDMELGPEEMRQIYVVDANSALLGRLELAEIVFAPTGSLVNEIMNRDVISVAATDDQEEAVRLMERYDLVSIPVTNQLNQLEGVIAVSELVEVAEEEATEDMFRMVGMGGGLRTVPSLRYSIRSRLPWLVLNLFTVMGAGFALSLFEPTLGALTVLAVFLPIVMGQAGIAGTQTVTIIVRSLALGERSLTNVPRLVIYELLLSITQGVVVGLILGVIVYLWKGDPALTALVTVSLLLNLMLAALSGVLVPLALRLVRIDPAMASAVIVTTATDIFGIVMYLGLASLFLTLLTD